MTETPVKTATDFALPPNVVSKVDLARMVSDLERVDDEMTTAGIRAGGAAVPVLPMSEQLENFLSLNSLEITDDRQRMDLIQHLRKLKDTVPIIHMTFAVQADRESLGQLAQWLRTSIHPQAVIGVGLQPGLVAGVYVRTPNHIHDLSIRGRLEASRGVLVQEMEALRGAK